MTSINWSTVRSNGEQASNEPIPPYTAAEERDRLELHTHLAQDHGYLNADLGDAAAAEPAESWAMLHRLHTAAQMLDARVLLNTAGGPA